MRRASSLIVALLALSSFACGSSSDGNSAYGEYFYPEEEARIHIEVTVTYEEDVMLPPGSTVRAALYDEDHELKPAISSNAVAAREGRGVPVELEITYPLDQVDDSHEHVVRGEIRDPQGNLLFMTDEPIPVEVEDEEPQKITLVLKPNKPQENGELAN